MGTTGTGVKKHSQLREEALRSLGDHFTRCNEQQLVELAIYVRDGGYWCHLCEEPIDTIAGLPRTLNGQRTYQLDHVLPKSLGGLDILGNLRFSHRSCNIQKGGRNRRENWKMMGFNPVEFSLDEEEKVERKALLESLSSFLKSLPEEQQFEVPDRLCYWFGKTRITQMTIEELRRAGPLFREKYPAEVAKE